MSSRARAIAIRSPSLVVGLLGVALIVVMSVVPFPLGTALPLALVLGTALLCWPALAPLLLVWSVPLQDVIRLPVGGLGLTATQLALAATFGVLLLVILAHRQPLRVSPIGAMTIVFLLVQFISLAEAQNLLFGVATIYRWFAALVAFLAVLHTVRSRRTVVVLALGLVVAAIFEVGFGLVQSLFGIAPPSFALSTGLYRAYGTFGQPNPYAGYLEMTGLWLAALALWALQETFRAERRYRRERARGVGASRFSRRWLLRHGTLAGVLLMGVLAALAGVLLSFSRGAWIGTVAGAAVFAVFAPRTVRRLLIGGGVVGVLALAVGGWQELPAALRERLEQTVTQLRPFDVRDVQLTSLNWAVVERMTHWQAAWAMFLEHPLTGVGAGNFSVAFPLYSPHPLFRIARGHAHNYYLHVLAELGLPGFVTYLALLGIVFSVSIATVRRSKSGFDRALALGSLAATVAVAVHNLVENLHELHLGVHLFALWALALLARDGWKETRIRTVWNR